MRKLNRPSGNFKNAQEQHKRKTKDKKNKTTKEITTKKNKSLEEYNFCVYLWGAVVTVCVSFRHLPTFHLPGEIPFVHCQGHFVRIHAPGLIMMFCYDSNFPFFFILLCSSKHNSEQWAQYGGSSNSSSTIHKFPFSWMSQRRKFVLYIKNRIKLCVPSG